MSSEKHLSFKHFSSVARNFRPVTLLVAAVLVMAPWAMAQSQESSSSSSAQTQSGQKQPDNVPAEAGGPGGETGPLAVPKKKDSSEDSTPPPSRPKKVDNMPEYSLTVDVPVVTVDARVVQKNGLPLALPPELKEHFRVLEDGVPQHIQSIQQSEAPITAVLLVEFSEGNYNFMTDALNASYAFASALKPQDWVAVVEFDMKEHILVDFTQDKQAIFGALNGLRIPGFHESNLWDAMFDTLDRLDRLPGHKELVVVASGIDSMSHLTFDKILKKVKATPNVTIYTISTGMAARLVADQGLNQPAMMNFVVADSQMKQFASLTGGHWYAPRFQGELPEVFREVAQSIRNQYTISYKPTNTKQDGAYRKLKVELVGSDDKPLVIKDEKNKEVKYQIIARDGYTAKHEVE